MPLAAGQSLSFYEILGPLGAGGMGEVYRAKDTRLEREVAIKVLPEELADDEERLRRFEREAKTLASLNHPNVAGIHGVDQEDDVCFLALELVPGEDLATRLSRGALSVDEAIDVCRQIAEGLEAAHEAGVIHRDLKPANVRVTPDGVVKILDFGLAKPIRPKLSQEGATTAESDSFLVTEEGVVLGTPTYMSPEQARGKPVDRRTDVWALGCILYECLTGRRPFGGESLTDVLASIVGAEPDWSRLPDLTPRVFDLLRRMLDKDARLRLRDAGEARVLLSAGGSAAIQIPRDGRPAWLGFGAPRVAALLVLVAVASGAMGLWLGRSSPDDAAGATPPRAFHGVVLEFGEVEDATHTSLSPDGNRVAWLDGRGLHVREIAEPEPWTVVEEHGLGPRFGWSPDGHELAYTLDGGLWTIASGGGTPRRLGDYDGELWSWIQWTEDHGIAYSTTEAIVSMLSGGERAVLVEYDEGIAHLHDFMLLPDGTSAIVVPHLVGGGPETIEVLRDQDRTVLVATRGHEPDLVGLTPDLSLYWAGSEGMWSLPLSEDLVPRRDSELVLPDVILPSLADDGTLAYIEGKTESQLGWVAREDGAFVPIGEPSGDIWGGRLSPDGKRIVFTDNEGSVSQTYVYDLERDLPTPWIRREDGTAFSAFLPDGRIIVALLSAGEGTLVYPASGEGEPELVEGFIVGASRDTGILVTRGFAYPGAVPNEPTYASGPGVEGGRLQILNGVQGEEFCDLSLDGEWLLYSSWRAGSRQIYLARFPPTRAEFWPVSAEGGEYAWFGDRMDEILFRSESAVYRVSLQVEGSVRLGAPERLFALSPRLNLSDFDGAARFVGVRGRIEGSMHVDTDWGRVVGR